MSGSGNAGDVIEIPRPAGAGSEEGGTRTHGRSSAVPGRSTQEVTQNLETAAQLTRGARRIVFQDNHTTQVLFGAHGRNLKTIEQQLEVTVNVRGSTVYITGDTADTETAASLLEQLYELVRDGFPLFPSDIDHAVRLIRYDHTSPLRQYFLDTVVLTARKKPIVPRTHVQKLYVDAIRKFDIVFGIGPAGTGKTYLAMAMAVGFLLRKEVARIVLTRPAVEAGERLGFLPGDLAEKVNPYLRPLYDALHDMMEFEKANRLIERGVIEVAPLAFMRGRTLNDAFVILDEAQNSTSEQMKMFLTRLGIGSKAVITGDVTQIDLPQGRVSGLLEAREVLRHIPRLRFIEFTRDDVVRHQLVQEVVDAYEHWEARRKQPNGVGSNGVGSSGTGPGATDSSGSDGGGVSEVPP